MFYLNCRKTKRWSLNGNIFHMILYNWSIRLYKNSGVWALSLNSLVITVSSTLLTESVWMLLKLWLMPIHSERKHCENRSKQRKGKCSPSSHDFSRRWIKIIGEFHFPIFAQIAKTFAPDKAVKNNSNFSCFSFRTCDIHEKNILYFLNFRIIFLNCCIQWSYSAVVFFLLKKHCCNYCSFHAWIKTFYTVVARFFFFSN